MILRATCVGSVVRHKPVGKETTPQSRSAVQLVPQLQTRSARNLLARLSARTLPTDSSAVCFTATVRQGEPRIATNH